MVSLLTACGNTREESDHQSREKDKVVNPLNFTRKVAFLKSKSTSDTVSSIVAAIADSKSEQQQGLMDVSDLPTDKGMLFIFGQEEPRSFWMANTPIPLDIIFVNSDKKIVRIHHSAQPFSNKQFPSDAPARYVIETNGGFCINHDIHEGMYVDF